MPTLEEISEVCVAEAERTIKVSKALDYAWMMDQVAIVEGIMPRHFHELIERQYAELLGAIDVNSNDNPGADPGS